MTDELDQVLDAIGQAVILLDQDGRILMFTDAAAHCLGLSPDDVGMQVRPVSDRIGWSHLANAARSVIDGDVAATQADEHKQPGGQLSARIVPRLSGSGTISGAIIIVHDHSERPVLDPQQTGLAEMRHRIRNLLAVIRSIASRSAAPGTSAEDYASHLKGRLDSVSRVQSLTMRAPDGGVDLETLIADEVLTDAVSRSTDISIIGPPLRLKSKAAEALGLVIHELSTNAVKFGALSVPTGRIDVTWAVQRDTTARLLVLTWKETGVALASFRPGPARFGMEMVTRRLPFETGGAARVAFDADGVRCTITVPLNSVAMQRADTPG